MKTALIPPIPELSRFGRGDIHLLLSHLFETPQYLDHYRREQAHGAYLILDNSAHERGYGDDPEILFKRAVQLHVDEIVLPDALFNPIETLHRTRESLEFLKSSSLLFERSSRGSPLSLMIVPQAESDDPRSWRECLLGQLDAYQSVLEGTEGVKSKPVLGVSKDYMAWDSGEGLLSLIEQGIGLGLEIHLLGWWWPNFEVLSKIERSYPFAIRSIDSAKPFVYALEGKCLDPKMMNSAWGREYIERQGDYFLRSFHSLDRFRAAVYNVGIFNLLAQGAQL